MKRICTVFLCALLILSLSACSVFGPEAEEGLKAEIEGEEQSLLIGKSYTDVEGINIYIANAIWEDDKTILEIKWSNDTQYNVSYGASYLIEREENGEWIDCTLDGELAFPSSGYALNPKSDITKKYTISNMFDVSKDGKYRFKTDCDVDNKWPSGGSSKCYLSVEFTLARSSSQPDDTEALSFSLTWNTYGISSYDSTTGKLVKTTDATNPADYVTTLHLTDTQKAEIWELICDLDIENYPDEYDPQGRGIRSDPSMTLILTVRTEDFVKTVCAEDIALSYDSNDPKGQKFLDVCKGIRDILTATDEWKALPEYEFFYD